MARECRYYEITIEKLLNVVHNYTDPIRIYVVMDNAFMYYDEAKHMHDFLLTSQYSYDDRDEHDRLLRYYKDVPVWNLTVWTDEDIDHEKGRTIRMGIEAHCHYKDIREGWLTEKADIAKQKRVSPKEKNNV